VDYRSDETRPGARSSRGIAIALAAEFAASCVHSPRSLFRGAIFGYAPSMGADARSAIIIATALVLALTCVGMIEASPELAGRRNEMTWFGPKPGDGYRYGVRIDESTLFQGGHPTDAGI